MVKLTEENTAMRNRLIALERENKMFENYAMECAMLMEVCVRYWGGGGDDRHSRLICVLITRQ